MEIGILVKENNQTKKLIKPERLFLMIALVAGLIFTVAQPLFIEPDSSYHLINLLISQIQLLIEAKLAFLLRIINPHLFLLQQSLR